MIAFCQLRRGTASGLLPVLLVAIASMVPASAAAADAPSWREQNDAAVEALREADRMESVAAARASRERALRLLDELLATAPPDEASHLRARLDRVVALTVLGQHEQALEAVAELRAADVTLPAYVLSSAGDAATGLRDPRQALRWYEEALATDPDAEAPHAGRIFALADLDRLDRAAEILRDRLATDGGHRDDRLRLALVTAWSGRVDAALDASQALVEEAPEDPEVLLQHGGILLQADRPRAALGVYDRVLAIAPGSRRAAVGRAQALARQGRGAEAEEILQTLAEQDPQWRPLVRARAELAADRAAQVSWDWRRGSGPDREIPGREWRREATLHTARTASGWRLFAGRREAEAEREGRRLHDRRTFAGASLLHGDWRLQAEIDRPDDRFDDGTGWALGVDWRPRDPWTVGVSYAANAFDLPLRAREQGITGDRAAAAVRWQPRAQHSARVSWAEVDYTDGNRSRAVGLSSLHRVPLGRRLTAVLEPGVWTSRQSRQDVPYFSPARDLDVGVAAALEQRLWVRPERRLGHALEVAVGAYDQKGFDLEPSARIGYRVDWDFAPGSRAFVRFSRSRRAYDGVQEYQSRIELGGWWSFGWRR